MGAASSRARAVGSKPSALRWNKGSPSKVRSRDRAALIAGWLTPTCIAARVTLRSLIRASNATSRFKSMP